MQPQVSRCYYHPEKGAVAICAECGVGICRECAVKDDRGRVLCYQCGNELLRQEHKENRKRLKESGGRFREGKDFIFPSIIGILIAVIFVVLNYYYGDGKLFRYGWWGVIGASYLLFSSPFCYIKLNDYFAPKYDTRDVRFTKWYFKVVISLLFGWIVFPFFLIRFTIGKFKSKKK